MKLINVSSLGNEIFLFTRDDSGNLKILRDSKYEPYFYEPSPDGEYTGYDGKRLKKITCNLSKQVAEMRSDDSYSSDIRYIINYISDKVKTIEKCPIKYFFIDIEVLTPDLPDIYKATCPVSCITIYNSFSKEYKTFYIGDYDGSLRQNEIELLKDFVDYIKEEKPDLLLAWNISFDYNYLYFRYKNLIKKDLAKELSPINQFHIGEKSENNDRKQNVFYPSGISILDYLQLFKKVNLRENSYKLDSVAEKHLGKGKVHKEVDFKQLSEEVKQRNIEDVELLVKLEEKYHIIDYFNEIRCFSKAIWEDLTKNSVILDSIFIEEAKKRNIVLPRKQYNQELESEELVGAYRRAESGIFFDIYKADVAGMYPAMIMNFCLDPANIMTPEDTRDPVYNNYVNINNEVCFKQDENALIPFITKKLVAIKNNLKVDLNKVKLNTEEHKVTQQKYDAIKGLVNSVFGVTALPSFRLYDYAVASAITFLARDLLQYVEKSMQDMGYAVIYSDTDALFYKAKKDEIDLLNSLVQKWAKDKYGKKSVDINFESEGKFTKLLILSKTHYYGHLQTTKGIKKEVKGLEMKRSSSAKYESYFQENLIEKILNKENKISIEKWIESEKERIKTLPLNEIAFPCKLTNKKYVNEPIFVRAYNNSKNLFKEFKANVGDNLYYIYIHSMGKDFKSKDINVLAFTKENEYLIDRSRVDYDEIIRRNIDSKIDSLFEAINWKQNLVPQFQLF